MTPDDPNEIEVGDLLATSADPTQIQGDFDKLIQVMTNPLQSAVKSPPLKGAIDTTSERHDGNIVISVSDPGSRVASGFREPIFEKIFQVESSDNCARRGTGLGLSI